MISIQTGCGTGVGHYGYWFKFGLFRESLGVGHSGIGILYYFGKIHTYLQVSLCS